MVELGDWATAGIYGEIYTSDHSITSEAFYAGGVHMESYIGE